MASDDRRAERLDHALRWADAFTKAGRVWPRSLQEELHELLVRPYMIARESALDGVKGADVVDDFVRAVGWKDEARGKSGNWFGRLHAEWRRKLVLGLYFEARASVGYEAALQAAADRFAEIEWPDGERREVSPDTVKAWVRDDEREERERRGD